MAASITSTPAAAARPSTCQQKPIKLNVRSCTDQPVKARRKLEMPVTTAKVMKETTQNQPIAPVRAPPSFFFRTTTGMLNFIALIKTVADVDYMDFCEELFLSVELNSKLVVQGLSHLY